MTVEPTWPERSGGATACSLRDIERTVMGFWSLGGEVERRPGHRIVRNRSAPRHPLGNFTFAVRDAASLEALLGPAASQDTALRRVVVDRDTPAEVEAELALHGWENEQQLQLVLPEATPVPAPTDPRLAAVTTDGQWRAIEQLFRIDHLEEDHRRGRDPRPASTTAAAVALRRSLTAGARYLVAQPSQASRRSAPSGSWPSPHDVGVAGCIAVWVSDDGVGMIEDVFVHPDARGAGVATQLLRFAVTEARGRGAGGIVIGAEIDDTPKHLYARFGFRPAAVLRSYRHP